MGEVYIYDKNAEDFSTTGLCGALPATLCEHEEIAGGASAVNFEMPLDSMGRWKHIQRGNILKCLCRVRTTPEIQAGQVITAVEKWIVKETATKKERGVFSKAEKGRRKATLKPGVEVIVTQKGDERYKIKSGKVTGWIAIDAIEFELEEVLPDGTDSIENVAPPWVVKYQRFRIQDVTVDSDSGIVTAYATHISCDLTYNMTRFKYDFPLTAEQCLNGCPDDCAQDHEHAEGGIMGSCDLDHEVEAFTDIGDTRTSAEYVNINPIEALLDPEEGFCSRWGAELVRDDDELYFLRRAGRNRGTRIEYAKNLLGVNMTVSDKDVYTAVLPLGQKKDGEILYLAEGDPEIVPIDQVEELETESGETIEYIINGKYIISPHAADYPFRRAYVLQCEDCTIERGKKGVTAEIARKRMIEQAQRLFSEDQIDLPSVDLSVNFVQLGDTAEFAQYKDLEPVYLYDEIVVAAKPYGVEVTANVHRVLWDCLAERMVEIELGNVQTDADIYKWQISSLDGRKIIPGTVPGNAIDDDGIPADRIDPSITEALENAMETLDSAEIALAEAATRLATAEEAIRNLDGDVSLLQQTASQITADVANAQGEISTLKQTASSLQTAITNAQGDISTLKQTASSLTTAVSNLNGDVSSLWQQASSITTTVSNIDGRVTQLEQTATGVAIKLYDPSVSSTFSVELGTMALEGIALDYESGPIWEYTNPATAVCLALNGGSSNYANIGASSNGAFLKTSGRAEIISGEYDSVLAAYDKKAVIFAERTDVTSSGAVAFKHAMLSCNAASSTTHIYRSKSLETYSDRRLKEQIQPIQGAEALFDALRPVQYVLTRQPSDGINYGFVAQDVEAALEAAGLDAGNMAIISRPESNSGEMEGIYTLAYDHFIALCVAKIQAQQAQINNLTKRLERLEGMADAVH